MQRWTTPASVAAALCGWVAVVVVAFTRTVTWDTSHVIAGQDVGRYLLDIWQISGGHGPVWHGFFSNLELGHPGPILYWIWAAGISVGGLIGGTNNTEAGMVIANAVAVATSVAVAGAIIAGATRRTWMAATIPATWITWMLLRPYRYDWPQAPAIHLTPIFGPNLAAALTIIAASTIYALYLRRWWAPGLAVAAGGTIMSAYVELAPYGGILTVAGISAWILQTRRQHHTNKHHHEQPASKRHRTIENIRRLIGRPHHGWTLAAGLVVGWGTFAIRMATETWTLPWHYIRDSIDAKQALAGGAARDSGDWITRLDSVWPGSWWSIIVLAAINIVCATRPAARRTAAANLTVVVAGVTYLTVIATAHSLQMAPTIAAWIVAVAGTIAAVDAAVLQTTGDTSPAPQPRRRPQRRAIAAVGAAAVTTVIVAATWTTVTDQYRTLTLPGDAVSALERNYELEQHLAHHSEKGQRVAIASNRGVVYGGSIDPDQYTDVFWSVQRAGRDACIVNTRTDANWTNWYWCGELDNIDAWIILDDNGNPPDTTTITFTSRDTSIDIWVLDGTQTGPWSERQAVWDHNTN